MRSRDLESKLAERALRAGWQVNPEMHPELIEKLRSIAMSTDGSVGAREKVSAIKALMLAGKLDLEAIKTAIVANEHDQVLEDLDELERARANEDDEID
jgi:hypothetical protein